MANPRATARVGGHPIHAMLAPFPNACFILTLLSDLAYKKTASMQWANLSVWLLTVGLVVAAFAVLAGLVDLLGGRQIRRLPSAYIHAIGSAIALVLAIANAFIHSRDAYTSVVPTGLNLSALTVAILLVTGWLGREMVFRHRIGVRENGQ